MRTPISYFLLVSALLFTIGTVGVTLDAGANAVDAAEVLPNITDGYIGAAPDLGALERGCPLPIYGVRTNGVDESNESLGCAP